MSTSTPRCCPSLPLELWIIIFSYATAPQRPQAFCREVEVMHILTLVCKLWRAMELPLLYETVSIKTPGMARRFLRTLVETASPDPQAGHGQWVRTIVLQLLKGDPWQEIQIINILERCPHLQILLKPCYSEHHDRSFWHGFGCTASCTGCPPRAPLTLTALRYVHWDLCPSTTVTDEVARLSTFLSHAPHLVSLSIRSSGEPYVYPIRPSIPLMSLTMIRYFGSGGLDLLPRDMPNLTRFIAPYEVFGPSQPILLAFGRQLKVIEFLDIHLCLFLPNPVALTLPYLPNLITLGYNINCVVLEYITADIAFPPSLQSIVIRMNPELRMDWPLESYLPKHFEVLTGPALPALRRVVLDGIDTPFHLGYEIMRRRFPVQRVQGTSVVWECSAVGVVTEAAHKMIDVIYPAVINPSRISPPRSLSPQLYGSTPTLCSLPDDRVSLRVCPAKSSQLSHDPPCSHGRPRRCGILENDWQETEKRGGSRIGGYLKSISKGLRG